MEEIPNQSTERKMTKEEFIKAIQELGLKWERADDQEMPLRCERGDCPIIALWKARKGDVIELIDADKNWVFDPNTGWMRQADPPATKVIPVTNAHWLAAAEILGIDDHIAREIVDQADSYDGYIEGLDRPDRIKWIEDLEQDDDTGEYITDNEGGYGG